MINTEVAYVRDLQLIVEVGLFFTLPLSDKLNLLIIGVLSEHVADAFWKGDYCGLR